MQKFLEVLILTESVDNQWNVYAYMIMCELLLYIYGQFTVNQIIINMRQLCVINLYYCSYYEMV